MKAAIVIFPGTNRERDVAIALRNATGQRPVQIWHGETSLPEHLDLLVLPGGFSHGDYLRCGAMAALSPIMPALHRFAAGGGHILGICNGFQILTEAGLLPGALLRNASLRFISRDCYLRVERGDTAFTRHYQTGQVFRAPMAHGDGNFFAAAETVAMLEGEGRVAFRYATPAGDVAPPREPERQRRLHRRHLQRKSARARADAASGGSGGSADGGHRRQTAVRWADRSAGGVRQGSMFFSEEKAEPALRNQKTFMSSAGPSPSGQFHDLGAGAEVKVFWFFSSEKNKPSLDFL